MIRVCMCSFSASGKASKGGAELCVTVAVIVEVHLLSSPPRELLKNLMVGISQEHPQIRLLTNDYEHV